MFILKRLILYIIFCALLGFLLIGMSFITHYYLITFIAVYHLVLGLLFSTKFRHVKYDNNSISYKKKILLFYDIDTAIFTETFHHGSIFLHKKSKKYFLTLSHIRLQKYKDLKQLIINQIDASKIKYRKGKFIILFFPTIFVLLFILSIIFNPNIPKFDFNYDSLKNHNIVTDHYAFKIDGIKYETMLSDSLFFLLTDKGKIFYKEFYDEGVSLRKFFDYPQLFEVNDLSQIDYWYSNDVGVFKRMCRYFSISVFKPILFESEEFKGVLLTTEDRKIKSLRLKKKGEKGFLLIEFSNQFIIDNVIEFLESVSYH
jgi:hypothetical protein